jgi:tetratricopeptide (TPR) repeat protein
LEGLANAMSCQGKWLEAESVFREAIRIQEPLARELPETSEFREDLALSLCNLGDVLSHLGRSAEEEAVLRRSIEISKGIITAAPRLIFRRVIIAGALVNLAACERNKGRIDASKALLAEARSHIRFGLEINPRDPRLNALNAEIDSLTKGKDPPEAKGGSVSGLTDRPRSSGKKEDRAKKRSTP